MIKEAEKKSKEDKGRKAEEKETVQTADARDAKDVKIKELINDLQRLQAEFENYKKRVDRDKDAFIEYAEAELMKTLLPAIDTLELSLSNTKDHDKFIKAVELSYRQLIQTLEDRGLKKIDAKGKKFDPHMHEALLAEESDKEEGSILEEFQSGYMTKDRVLRHSKVKIARQKTK